MTDRDPTRRSVLRGLAGVAAAGLAGCGGLFEDDDASTLTPAPVPGTRSTSPVPTTAADALLGVAGVGRRYSFFYRLVEDVSTMNVAGEAGRQYLFVALNRDGPRPRPPAIRLDTDDRSFRGTLTPGLPEVYASRLVIDPWGQADPIGGVAEWVAFELPAPLAIDRASVRPTPESQPVYELPGSLLEALRSDPPGFSVREVALPDRVGPHDPVPFGVTVRNRGGRGTFRGVLSWTDARGPAPQQTPVAGTVPPGTHTLDGTFESIQRFDGPEITFRLDTPGGETIRTVAVETADRE